MILAPLGAGKKRGSTRRAWGSPVASGERVLGDFVFVFVAASSSSRGRPSSYTDKSVGS